MKYCLSSIYKNTLYECENQVTISGITCLLKCLSRFIIPYTKSPFEGSESTFKTYSCFQQYFQKTSLFFSKIFCYQNFEISWNGPFRRQFALQILCSAQSAVAKIPALEYIFATCEICMFSCRNKVILNST